MTLTKTLTKLLMAAALALPVAALPVAQANAAVFISVGFAPPVLPVYAQPYCPGAGYIWTPGYWAYGQDGYYWVPGEWVLPPEEGLLWTPAWWGWEGNAYIFHEGYWGSHVGFYGGINYGFGYNGAGFVGGEWRGHTFFYNRAVANVGAGFHNIYSRPVEIRTHSTVSFNGGRNGIQARPSVQENAAMSERHFQPTANQASRRNYAAQDRGQRATVNQREGNQQQRIANGVRSGQMTSGEAARADQRQANIDSQVHNERTANGGRLTPQERQQTNREQNRASGQIDREKHNDKKASAENRRDKRD
jgi:hypothetical protein